MILQASQRGGGMALAAHLLKSENEHVEVHEIRGFASGTLPGACKEAEGIAKGTRCKQHLFSVSLNPPANENVPIAVFETAIERVEQANGLTGHPRMVVFHEKEGRRHAHAVWSRIDPNTMTAKRMSHFKMKLREVSKSLYLEHGWQMPRGLVDGQDRNPRNFSLAEWQQVKRMGRDAGALKATVQECWAVSKDPPSFAAALESRGLYLAKGDRRGAVVLTYEGEVLSLARTLGKRTKEVTAKLGKADDLRSVADTKRHIAAAITPRLKELIADANRKRTEALRPLDERRKAMKADHASERQRLDKGQTLRRETESRARAERLRPGLRGLLDRVSGRHAATVRQNDAEALAGFRRDRGQRDDLISGQLDERRGLQREIVAVRHRHAGRIEDLHRDLSRQTQGQERESIRSAFNESASGNATPAPPARSRAILRGRGSGRDGPGLGR